MPNYKALWIELKASLFLKKKYGDDIEYLNHIVDVDDMLILCYPGFDTVIYNIIEDEFGYFKFKLAT